MVDFRHYHIAPLILVVLGISAALGKLSDVLQDHGLEHHGWVGGVSVVSLTAGFLKVYDQWLWRLPVLRLLVRVPCIAGNYRGQIEYVYEEVPQVKRIEAEITQTASHVHVCCKFFSTDTEGTETTKSRSIHADLFDRSGHWQLCMLYENEGERVRGSTAAHDGFAVLDVLEGGKALDGHYFTGRKTRGSMVLKRR
ncbi:MAG: hypothetical protein IPJ76_15050 [Flavobacteriales bacterium]|nr:MAG: hypothetical protein IPJ76_15050 [Flavobacteriales bacterium]